MNPTAKEKPMATKKGAKKATSKGAAKSYSKGKQPPGGVIRPLYGVVIRDCIARGDKQEMRKISTAARKHLKDVQAALAKLEAQIGKG
jgi:Domain of unknown function (DUF1843)